MSSVLRLEDFARPAEAPAPSPLLTAEDLADARADGYAAGQADALATVAAQTAEAAASIAASLARDERDLAAVDAAWRRRSATLLQAVVEALAPRREVAQLAEMIGAEILAIRALEPAAEPVLRCPRHLAEPLAGALAAAGAPRVKVESGDTTALLLPDACVTFDRDAVRAAISRIIDELEGDPA